LEISVRGPSCPKTGSFETIADRVTKFRVPAAKKHRSLSLAASMHGDDTIARRDKSETIRLVEVCGRDVQSNVATGLATFEAIEIEFVSGDRRRDFGCAGLNLPAMRCDHRHWRSPGTGDDTEILALAFGPA